MSKFAYIKKQREYKGLETPSSPIYKKHLIFFVSLNK